MLVKTILNQVHKCKSFVYKKVRLLGSGDDKYIVPDRKIDKNTFEPLSFNEKLNYFVSHSRKRRNHSSYRQIFPVFQHDPFHQGMPTP